MPGKTYWIDEPTILAADYEGHLSETELDEVMATCLSLVETRPCYFLVDTLKMTSIQPSFFKLGSLLRFLSSPNLRWIVFVVSYNPVVKFAIQVLVRRNATVVADRDEALALLRNRVRVDKEAAEVATRLSA